MPQRRHANNGAGLGQPFAKKVDVACYDITTVAEIPSSWVHMVDGGGGGRARGRCGDGIREAHQAHKDPRPGQQFHVAAGPPFLTLAYKTYQYDYLKLILLWR